LIAENDSNNEKNSGNPHMAFSSNKHPEEKNSNEQQHRALLIQICDERHKNIENGIG
jgi:hypothetical protein